LRLSLLRLSLLRLPWVGRDQALKVSLPRRFALYWYVFVAEIVARKLLVENPQPDLVRFDLNSGRSR
jgi:hypothetical protein